MESKIQKSFIQTNMKNILLAVMALNLCVDDNFSKSFETYLSKYAIYYFINNMIEESKHCSEVKKTIFFRRNL